MNVERKIRRLTDEEMRRVSRAYLSYVYEALAKYDEPSKPSKRS